LVWCGEAGSVLVRPGVVRRVKTGGDKLPVFVLDLSPPFRV
jgi:hypothetical protein